MIQNIFLEKYNLPKNEEYKKTITNNDQRVYRDTRKIKYHDKIILYIDTIYNNEIIFLNIIGYPIYYRKNVYIKNITHCSQKPLQND